MVGIGYKTMEANHGGGGGGGGGTMPASMGSSAAAAAAGMVGLDMPLHDNRRRSGTTTTQPPQQHHFLPFPTTQHRHEGLIDDTPQQQQLRHTYAAFPTQQQQTPLDLLSDQGHETAAFGVGDDDGANKRFPQQSSSSSPSPSPWHRMKWTDSMVRLLIMIVYCVGDDLGNSTGTEADHHPQPSPSTSACNNTKGKKARATSPPSSAATSAGMQLLQKKGKWKSVSRAMMEKGFYVSPQQCEDKFNDLNKRYKRVNELLGKGTACRVVENQALLDSMDHLPPKAKEEARKLLNSKHLFFREMCAYHNSGGVPCNTTAGAAAAAGAPAPAASSTLLASQPHPSPPTDQPSHQHQHQQQQQQQCLHHTSADSSAISFPGGEALFVGKGSGRHGASNRRLGGVSEAAIEKENHDEDDDEELEEDYDDDDEDLDDDNENDDRSRHYREKKESSKVEARGNCMLLSSSPLSASPPLSLSLQSSSPVPMSASVEQMTYDLMGSLASMGGEQQRRQWLKRKAAELEEQRVRYQSRALELERQRFKWLRYSSNKEREMERMKLSNERLCLENDRILLLLRQKEQELNVNAAVNADGLHHSSLR